MVKVSGLSLSELLSRWPWRGRWPERRSLSSPDRGEVSLLEVGVILVFPIEPPRSVHNAQGRDDNHGHPKAGESFLGTRFWTWTRTRRDQRL